jgi:hypothetical protein
MVSNIYLHFVTILPSAAILRFAKDHADRQWPTAV